MVNSVQPIGESRREESEIWFFSGRELGVVVGLGLGWVLGFSYLIGMDSHQIGDSYLYYIQALNPLSVISPPHGLRWLTPRLAYLLPVSIPWAFYGITVCALAGTMVLAYFNLRVLGCKPLTVGAVFCALAVNPGFYDTLYYPIYVDPLSFFLLELGILAILIQHDRLFAVSLVLGVLNRETALFLIPVYHIARYRRWGSWSAILRTGAVCASALVAFLATRFLLYSLSDTAYINRLAEQFYGLDADFKRFDQYYWGELKKLWMESERWGRIMSIDTLCSGFQSLVPLAILGFCINGGKSRALLLYLICVWGQIFYALMVERLMFYTFPVYLLWGGLALRSAQDLRPLFYASLMGIAVLIHLLIPHSWLGGIGLAVLLLVLLKWDGNRLSLWRREPRENDSYAPWTRALRDSFGWINGFTLVVVSINIGMIYLFRPVMIERLAESFAAWQPVSKLNIHDAKPSYLGEAGIVDFVLPDGRRIDAWAVDVGAKPAKMFVPLRGTGIRGERHFILVNVVYPLAVSELGIAIVGPHKGGDPSKLFYKSTSKQKYGAQQRMGLVRKSLPLFFVSDMPERDCLNLQMTPSLMLLDVIILKGDVYTWFQRNDYQTIGSNAIELN